MCVWFPAHTLIERMHLGLCESKNPGGTFHTNRLLTLYVRPMNRLLTLCRRSMKSLPTLWTGSIKSLLTLYARFHEAYSNYFMFPVCEEPTYFMRRSHEMSACLIADFWEFLYIDFIRHDIQNRKKTVRHFRIGSVPDWCFPGNLYSGCPRHKIHIAGTGVFPTEKNRFERPRVHLL